MSTSHTCFSVMRMCCNHSKHALPVWKFVSPASASSFHQDRTSGRTHNDPRFRIRACGRMHMVCNSLSYASETRWRGLAGFVHLDPLSARLALNLTLAGGVPVEAAVALPMSDMTHPILVAGLEVVVHQCCGAQPQISTNHPCILILVIGLEATGRQH